MCLPSRCLAMDFCIFICLTATAVLVTNISSNLIMVGINGDSKLYTLPYFIFVCVCVSFFVSLLVLILLLVFRLLSKHVSDFNFQMN
jgi:hypothetical protein